MEINTIDASQLSKMFLAGAKNLEAKKEWINELNVFPVPDGDTGTNMTMTIMSAAKEVSALEQVNMRALCRAEGVQSALSVHHASSLRSAFRYGKGTWRALSFSA